MNFEGLEKKTNWYGRVSYWEGEKILYKECSKCGEIKSIDCFNESKTRGKIRSACKDCTSKKTKEYREKNAQKLKEAKKEYYDNHKEEIAEKRKIYREVNKEKISIRRKGYREKNKESISESKKRWAEANKEHVKEQRKEYWDRNREILIKKSKIYQEKNKEKLKEYRRNRNENIKKENLENITNLLKQIKPILNQLDLQIFGYIYKITNINGHCYIGQSVRTLKERYKENVINGWIKERMKYDNQKFKEELQEEDFTIEVIDFGVCQYHLDKLEAYYIDKYDSCNNGYNNREGNHKTNDGLEEFQQILKENGLEFIDGKLVKIA